MCFFVGFTSCRIRESLVAVPTAKWFLSCVNPHVSLEVTSVGKFLPTVLDNRIKHVGSSRIMTDCQQYYQSMLSVQIIWHESIWEDQASNVLVHISFNKQEQTPCSATKCCTLFRSTKSPQVTQQCKEDSEGPAVLVHTSKHIGITIDLHAKSKISKILKHCTQT